MKPRGLQELEHRFGEPLETLIPRTIEECGSVLQAARKLGKHPQSIEMWLARQGFVVKRITIAKVERQFVPAK